METAQYPIMAWLFGIVVIGISQKLCGFEPVQTAMACIGWTGAVATMGIVIMTGR